MRVIVIATISAILLATAVAAAQPHSVSDDAMERARAHDQAGSAYFEAGDWDNAIREYLTARAMHPLPEFEFNIAQAYRLKGDRRKAIAHYEEFLKARPNGDASDWARKHVEALKRELAVPIVPEPPRTDDPRPEPKPSQPPVYRRWWVWGLVGVAVAGAGVATAISLRSPGPTPIPETTDGTIYPYGR